MPTKVKETKKEKEVIQLQDAMELVISLSDKPILRKALIEKAIETLGLSKNDLKNKTPGGYLNRLKCQIGCAIQSLIKSEVLKEDDDKMITYVKKESQTEIVEELKRDDKIRKIILTMLESGEKKKTEIFSEAVNALKSKKLTEKTIKSDTGRILSELEHDKTIIKEKNTYSLKPKETLEEANKRIFDTIPDEALCYHTMLLFEKYFKSKNTDCEIYSSNTDGPDDNGIDGVVIIKDDLGHEQRIIIQVKNKQKKEKLLPQRMIKEFGGTLAVDDAIHGIFVTSANYQQGTKEYAKSYTKRIKRLDLIDGKKWLELASKLEYSLTEQIK